MVKKQTITKKCKVAKLEQFAVSMIEMHLRQIQESDVQAKLAAEPKLNPDKIIEYLPKTDEERVVKKALESMEKDQSPMDFLKPLLQAVMSDKPALSLPPPPPLPIIMFMPMEDYEKLGKPTIGDTLLVTLSKQPEPKR